MNFSKFIPLIIFMTFVSGCGLAVSNEEQISRAEASMAEGEFRAASIALKTVLADESENAIARLLLAEVSLGLGEILEAEKEIRLAADLGAPEDRVRPIFLEVLLAKGEFDSVLVSLSEDMPGLTEEQELRYRGAALIGNGSYEQAKNTYREWMRVDSENIDALIGMARAFAAGGETDEAIAEIERALLLEPLDSDALEVLGRLQAGLGMYAEAVESLSSAIENSNRETEFLRYLGMLFELGQAQISSQQMDAARLTVDRLTGAAPATPPTYFIEARLAYETGDYAGAARALRDC